MAAVIHASGVFFDPDAFLAEGELEPSSVYRRGELFHAPGHPDNGHHAASGFDLVVSEADYREFPRQAEEATAFLLANRDEFARLRDARGIERLALDFEITRHEIVVQGDALPPSLAHLADELGLIIEFSHIPDGDEPGEAA
ncbi:hypothetical protein EP7_000090 [Isosphaeraceae bacterium EP7]